MTKGKSILDLISTPRKVKIEIEDVPNYDLIHPIWVLYDSGDLDNMILEIVKYPYGALDFFKCLGIYLKVLYDHPDLRFMMNGDYRTIVNEYTKRMM